MKYRILSPIKIIAVAFVIIAILLVVSYYFLLPALFPPPPASEQASWLTPTGAAFIACLAAAAVAGCVSGILHLRNSRMTRAMEQDMIDQLIYPLLMIDSSGNYFDFNREAERILDLNRRTDIGKPADRRLIAPPGSSDYSSYLNGVAAAPTGAPARPPVIELHSRRYHILSSPGGFFGMHDAGTLITLMEVTREVKIRETLPAINKAMAVLESNSLKIMDSSTSLSQGATEQASSLASITSFLGEINKKSQGSSDAASQGTKLAVQAREAAERSGTEITNALKAMEDVQDAGIRIARIVKIIDDVAFQTNLLALNAAVEAARAGRQGKGFAVVADEVRNLAGRSAKAAKDTATMVEDITERIGNASNFIYKLEDMLNNIVQDAIRMADTTASASSASAEQAGGILQVNHELSQMDAVTHNTMLAAEQTATAVGVLTRQATDLRKMIEDITEAYLYDKAQRAGAAGSGDGIKSPEYRTLAGNSPYRPGLYANGEAADRILPPPEGRSNPQAAGPWRQDAHKNRREDDGWDMAAELASPSILPELLRRDGTLSGASASPLPTFADAAPAFGDSGNADRRMPPDGEDSLVKPTQKIILDDSEFGRY